MVVANHDARLARSLGSAERRVKRDGFHWSDRSGSEQAPRLMVGLGSTMTTSESLRDVPNQMCPPYKQSRSVRIHYHVRLS
jgi:hypothetical protein